MKRNCLLLMLILALMSCKNKTLFERVDSSYSGIHFNNAIIENDILNPLDVTNIYNGGGVGIGDFNNDGLQDIYFTGNTVSNKLYLNKGELQFEDITDVAKVSGEGRWSRGVSVVDINNDGWMDLYISTTMLDNAAKRENILYINQGVDKKGLPQFKDMAAEYGLNDTTHSTMAAYFDYDNDRDLDMYLVVNVIPKGENSNIFKHIATKGEHPSTGKLYRNDWNDSLHHSFFTDISRQAGITIEGYGHSASITDINKDGWKDIYVANDFMPNNILYINSRNGTFTDKVKDYFKHTSVNSMGQDIIDINNDGLSDVIELDMNPQDNYRKKMMMNANSYQYYQNSDHYGYQYQYVRNAVQVNQGPRVGQNDSIGDPVFSDIGFFSGIAETDWSWAPVVTDFDNDGYRDIIVTNGYPKDVTDHDFMAFRDQAYQIASKETLLEQIPEVKLHNYAYQNNGNLTFSDVTNNWGITIPSFSNGAAYADLDNDGDMDLVVNNINDEAFLYENTSEGGEQHYLNINLIGDSLNRNGLGAWVEIYYNGQQQVYEQNPYRGYLSSVQLQPHFGLGTTAKVNSLVVKWPNGKMQILQNVPCDQTITIDIRNANQRYSWFQPILAPNTLFTEITDSLGFNFLHQESDFVDFNIQKLLPHKLSEYGPALSVGDIDGNGLEDIIVGGSMHHSATVLQQQSNGSFTQKLILPDADGINKNWEDMGLLLFDADGDHDLDLYTASGGYESPANTKAYTDKLFINDGKGGFTLDSLALPQNLVSKSCVRAADFDQDGDLDLFIAGRVEPWSYPKPVSSFIFRNDSQNDHVHFTDVTASVAKPLLNIGLIGDAIWTDFNNDGMQDLVLAGEWSEVKFLENNKGVLEDVSAYTGISDKLGWWNSIVPGDFDNDGDIDYVAGNHGLNSLYKASPQYPVRIYAKDFNGDGNYDAIPTLFLPASQKDTTRREFPVFTRDDMAKQMISFKFRFQTYRSFAIATIDQVLTRDDLKDALKLETNYFNHSFIKNLGNGKFEVHALPLPAQYSCLNGMLADDFNGDGNLDLLANGNDYGTEVSVGRYDACNGLFLKGDGRGGFTPLPILESGWFVPGNAKALVKLRNHAGQTLIVTAQNRGPLKMYVAKKTSASIALQPDDVTAIVTFAGAKKQKQEVNYGSSFLSQSGRFLNVSPLAQSVTVINNRGSKRLLTISK
jgi:hypothetical protein